MSSRTQRSFNRPSRAVEARVTSGSSCRCMVAFTLLLANGACSGGGSSGTSVSGGSLASGGSSVRAGTTGAGGAVSSGGQGGSSGTTATGGSVASGGASGGTIGAGGSLASGGTISSGGISSSGGASATGGTSATGGRTGTGGAPATGGTLSTGGAPATGGTSADSTGGRTGSGGALGTGGTSSTGGAASTGGTNAPATGGATGTGGASSTGGASGAGGSGNTIGSLALRGVNLSCAEWGTSLPGTFNTDYTYPDSHYVPGYVSPTYYVSKKMTVFRLPFAWERLQPTLNQAFNSDELSRLDTTVTDLLATGAYVILDLHNYARYNGTVIGSGTVTQAAFADLWARFATKYGSNPKVLFGLMNEPHDIDNTVWVNAAQAAITAIRATGTKNLILVASNSWDNAAAWTTYADALLTLKDSASNLAFEAHNYFNAAASDSQTCTSATIGVERLTQFTNWLKKNNLKGFLGEFSGSSADANCKAAVTNTLQHIVDNSSVYLGWAWWAGGPWWGSNWASIEPSGTTDNVRMTWLVPYL